MRQGPGTGFFIGNTVSGYTLLQCIRQCGDQGKHRSVKAGNLAGMATHANQPPGFILTSLQTSNIFPG